MTAHRYKIGQKFIGLIDEGRTKKGEIYSLELMPYSTPNVVDQTLTLEERGFCVNGYYIYHPDIYLIMFNPILFKTKHPDWF